MTTSPAALDERSHSPVWTDEAFLALPDDGQRYEIVANQLVDMGYSGTKHGYICALLSGVLLSYTLPKKLGIVIDSSTAFKMKNGNKRSPDVSLVVRERLQQLGEIPDGFFEGAPELAIEVLSPGNTVEEIHKRLVDYFESGTRLAWVVHPQEQYVLVYRSATSPQRLLVVGDSLDGEDIVPGFTYPLAELFQTFSL